MPLLEIRHVTKRYGDLAALDSVSLSVRAGTILALLGENGAGKSTLMKVCYGLLQPDAGELRWEGSPLVLPEPAAARRTGIAMVHQHFTLAGALTVAENIALAAPPRKMTPHAMRAAATSLMERCGLRVEPGAVVDSLPVGLRQKVEILKSLATSARLLILDEPTGVLSPPEIAELFDVLGRLRDAGTAVILITHKLPEALALADDVAVLRRGRLVFSEPRSGLSEDALARAMVGRPLSPPAALEPSPAGDTLVESPLLSAPGAQGVLRSGETVGVAGVEGNGQIELAEALVGLRRGPIRLRREGSMVDASSLSVARRIAWGLACIPDDRHARALALDMPLRENLSLGGGALPRRGLWIHRAAERTRAANLIRQYGIQAHSMESPVGSLSGGNQQKTVLARELSRKPRVLIAANPTRGLDVAATEFVHDALRAHRASGGATLLISSDLDEVLALSDRTLIMYGGRMVAQVMLGEASNNRDRLARLMTGAEGPGQ